MTEKTMQLVRVSGGLYETLEVRPGLAVNAPRGQPFNVPADFGKKLLEDGAGRWALPGSPDATRAAGELAAHEAQMQKDKEDAKKAAAKAKGGGS